MSLKKGLTYISERTGQLRYSDVNKDEKWLQPISEYVPIVRIKRGQPVSIATKEDIEAVEKELQKTNNNDSLILDRTVPYITLSNPKVHTHSIGLAQEYSTGVSVNNGKIVNPEKIHVLGFGKFEYDLTYAYRAGITTSKSNSDKEYFPSFLYGYEDNVGKTVYVKSMEDNITDALPGLLTIRQEEAYLNGGNVIVIGHVADAKKTTTYNYKTSSNITEASETESMQVPYGIIEINLEGDDRGALDFNLIEGEFGEECYISDTEQIKVFALGCEDDSSFSFTLTFIPHPRSGSDVPGGYIALQRMDGKTVRININSKANIPSVTDTAFELISQYYTLEAIEDLYLSYDKFLINDNSELKDALKAKLKAAMAKIAYQGDTNNNNKITGLNGYDYDVITGFTFSDKNYDTGAFIIEAEANKSGGFYEIYISSSLRDYFKVEAVTHGSYYNKGYAVLADIRRPERQNIIGIYYSQDYNKTFVKKEKAVFLRNGLFKLKDVNGMPEFLPGKSYYLSTHGTITPKPQYYFNSIVKIGIAQTSTKIIIDAKDPRRYNNGDLPVGYMKPSVGGEAEFGFLLMDGKTIHLVEDYEPLYKIISNWYTSDQLQYADVRHVGDKEINRPSFILPLVQFTSGNYVNFDDGTTTDTKYVPAQIKWLFEGVYKELPRLPFIRKEFEFKTIEEDGIVKASIDDIDITDLILYGPDEEKVQIPELERLDIKLFVDFEFKPGESHTHQWTEIETGFHSSNKFEYYGFKWAVTKVEENCRDYPFGRWALQTIIDGDADSTEEQNAVSHAHHGKGICYRRYPLEDPITLAGKYGRIIILKKEIFPREFSIENLFNVLVKEHVTDLDGNPWRGFATSGNAVRNDINEKVFTNELTVASGARANPTNDGGIVDIEATHFNFKATRTFKDEQRFADSGYDGLSKNYHITSDIRFTTTNSHLDDFKGTNEEISSYNTMCLDYYNGYLEYFFTNNRNNRNNSSSTLENNEKFLESAIRSNNFRLMPIFIFKKHEVLSANNRSIIRNGNRLTNKEIENEPTNYPHGLSNSGFNGNLDAKALIGMVPGFPGVAYDRQTNTGTREDINNVDPGAVTTNISMDLTHILPYLEYQKNEETKLEYYRMTVGAKINRLAVNSDKTLSHTISSLYEIDGDTSVTKTDIAYTPTVNFILKGTANHSLGSINLLNFILSKDTSDTRITNIVTSVPLNFQGDITIQNLMASSTKEVKDIVVEYLHNITGVYENNTTLNGDKISSALKTIHEIPLAEFTYKKSDDQNYKNHGKTGKRNFGIVTEQIKKQHDELVKANSNYLTTVIPFIENKNSIENETYSDILNGQYKYTDVEKTNIANYLEYLTNDQNKAQNVLSTVGILLKAAQETQTRLLALEASAFGDDNPFHPGYNSDETSKFTTLGAPNQNNTTLGANRLLKLLCMEVFKTSNPQINNFIVSNKWKTDSTRVDRLDAEINGDAAWVQATAGTDDHPIYSLTKAKGTTYPLEITPTSYENSYTKAESVVTDTDNVNFKDEEKYLKQFDDKSVTYKTPRNFDGLNDAVNRIALKLNQLTINVNGSDEIRSRPKRLDVIRENIDTLIRELYQDYSKADNKYYHDNGANSKPYFKNKISRIDALIKRLYNYEISLKNDENLGTNDVSVETKTSNFSKDTSFNTYQVSSRTLNGKPALGNITKTEDTNEVNKFNGVAPQKIDDYDNYATIIDFIIDILVGDESKLIRGNYKSVYTANQPYNDKYTKVSANNALTELDSYRNHKTIVERIKTIENALDFYAKRFRNSVNFENDLGLSESIKAKNHYSYTNTNSIDDFMDMIANYLGIEQFHKYDTDNITPKIDNVNGGPDTKQDEIKWTSTELTTTSAEQIANVGRNTKLQPAVYDAVKRLRLEEYKSKAIEAYLGKDFNSLISKNVTDDLSESNDTLFGVPSPTYTVSSDINALLRLLYGEKSDKEPNHFLNTEFPANQNYAHKRNNKQNALQYLFNELYKLPTRLDNDGNVIENPTQENDKKENATYYNLNTGENGINNYSSKKALYTKNPSNVSYLDNDNRNNAFSGSYRNRFEVIEDSIAALRNFVGMNNATNTSKNHVRYTGIVEAVNLKTGFKFDKEPTIAGLTIDTSKPSVIQYLLNYIYQLQTKLKDANDNISNLQSQLNTLSGYNDKMDEISRRIDEFDDSFANYDKYDDTIDENANNIATIIADMTQMGSDLKDMIRTLEQDVKIRLTNVENAIGITPSNGTNTGS